MYHLALGAFSGIKEKSLVVPLEKRGMLYDHKIQLDHMISARYGIFHAILDHFDGRYFCFPRFGAGDAVSI